MISPFILNSTLHKTLYRVYFLGLFCLFCFLFGCQNNQQITSSNSVTTTPSEAKIEEATRFSEPISNLVPTNTTTPLQSTLTPQAFVSSRHTQNLLLYQADFELPELYLFNPNDENQLVQVGLIVEGQPWSPDGTKFIFNDSQSHNFRGLPAYLSVYNTVTGQISSIDLLIRRPLQVYWSPDGQSLFYIIGQRDDPNNPIVKLIVYNFESQENRIITEISSERNNPFLSAGWSPDSQKFAFITKLNGQFDVYTLDIRSATLQQLTNSLEVEVMASWSPVENHLLVGTTSYTDEGIFYILQDFLEAGDLLLLDEDGQTEALPEESFRGINGLTWSPDGQRIAYSVSGKLCILTFKNGHKDCPLEEALPVDSHANAVFDPPSWSSDGRWLAFRSVVKNELRCQELYVFELATHNLIKLEQGSCFGSPAYWSP